MMIEVTEAERQMLDLLRNDQHITLTITQDGALWAYAAGRPRCGDHWRRPRRQFRPCVGKNRGQSGSKAVANAVLFSLATGEMLMISRAGRVAEWFKAAVLKTARARKGPRGFESHPFRQRLW